MLRDASHDSSRIPSLDGLRAVSIALVILSHSAHPSNLFWNWIPEGALGVRVFFVISGFIITRLLLMEESRNGRISLAGFYRRRALRILPAFWCYLAVVSVLGWAGCFPFQVRKDLLPALTFTLGLPIWNSHIAWQTVHAWSLSIEEQFYLLWPVAFVFCRRKGRLAMAAMAILAGPIIRYWLYEHSRMQGLNWSIFMHGDMLAMGCLLAIFSIARPQQLAKLVAWRPAIGRVLAVAVILFAPWYFERAFGRLIPPLSGLAFSMSAQAMAIAYLIASLTIVRIGVSYRLLNLQAVAAVGVMSYGLYLWQQLFFSQGEAWWTHWPGNVPCLIAAAAISFFGVERPIRNLGRRPNPPIPVESPRSASYHYPSFSTDPPRLTLEKCNARHDDDRKDSGQAQRQEPG